MALTKTERVMLANQNRILALLDQDNSETYLFKAEIAEKGYEGLYHKLLNGIDDEISEEICRETHEILTMYRGINNFITTLTPEQQEALDLDSIKFEGFDANNDDHYSFMKFIVEKASLYEEYEDVDFNSHDTATLGKYKRMLPTYRQLNEDNNLNLAGIQAIIGQATSR